MHRGRVRAYVESCAIEKVGHLRPRRLTFGAENAETELPLQPLGLFYLVVPRPACHHHSLELLKQVAADRAPPFTGPAIGSLARADLHDSEVGQIVPRFPHLSTPSIKSEWWNRRRQCEELSHRRKILLDTVARLPLKAGYRRESKALQQSWRARHLDRIESRRTAEHGKDPRRVPVPQLKDIVELYFP